MTAPSARAHQTHTPLRWRRETHVARELERRNASVAWSEVRRLRSPANRTAVFDFADTNLSTRHIDKRASPPTAAALERRPAAVQLEALASPRYHDAITGELP